MTEWQPETRPKSAGDILVSLFDQVADANLRFATGELQHDEWTAEMRLIDQKLAIFGLRLDRPERFSKPGGRL
jgi:hypothetical protein